ncbi:MAG: InlB B-repeat-containing protein [Nitrososphaerales archaeon]
MVICSIALFLLILSSSLTLSFVISPIRSPRLSILGSSGTSVTISTTTATPGSIVSISGTGFYSDHYVNVSVLQGLNVYYFTAITGTDCSSGTLEGYTPPSGTFLCPANGVVPTGGGSLPSGDCPVISGTFDCLFIVPSLPKYAAPCPSAGNCGGDSAGVLYAYGDSNDFGDTKFSVLDGIGLVPNVGAPGTQVTVYGDGWVGCFLTKYGGLCDITTNYNWDGQYLLQNAILFKFNTNCLPDPSGDISQEGSGYCTFEVPNNSTGAHTMTVTSYFPLGIKDKSQSATFLISPPQILGSVLGSQFELSGYDFSSYDSSVEIQISQLSQLYSNVYSYFNQQSCSASAGAFSCSIDAGQTLSPGPYTVLVQGVYDLSPATTTVSVTGSYPLSFDPKAVFPGQTLKVTGYGFDYSDTEVSLTVGAGGVIASCPVSNGIFSCEINAPTYVQLGSKLTIAAVGNIALDSQSGTLNVYPIVSSNPISGTPGKAIELNGTGFDASDTFATVSMDGRVLGSCPVVQSGGLGSFSLCPLTVPDSLAPGDYNILATGNSANDNATALFFVGGATISPSSGEVASLPPFVTVTGTNIGYTQNTGAGLQFVSDGVAELNTVGNSEFCPISDGSFSCQYPSSFVLSGERIAITGWALFSGSGCPIAGYSSYGCVQMPITYSTQAFKLYDQPSVSVSCSPDPALLAQNSETSCTATVSDPSVLGTPLGTVSWDYSGPSGGSFATNMCTLAKVPPPLNQPYLITPSSCSVQFNLPDSTSGPLALTAFYSGASGFPNYDPANVTSVMLPLTLESTGIGNDATGSVLTIGETGYSASQLPVTVWGTYGENLSAFSQTVSAGSGKQYALTSFSGCGGANLNPPLTVTDSCSTVTANYITQYYLTDSSDISALSPAICNYNVGTCDVYEISPSPFSGWFDAGTRIDVTSYNLIAINGLTGNNPGLYDAATNFVGTGSAPSSGTCLLPADLTLSSTCTTSFVINSPSSVTWIWSRGYGVTISDSGVGSDAASSPVVRVNGIDYTQSEMPFSIISTSSDLSYSFYSTVAGTSAERYVWSGTSGSSTTQSGILDVSSSGASLDATYSTQFLVTLEYSLNGGGSPSAPTVTYFSGGVLETATASPSSSSSPTQVWVDLGTSINYTNPLVGSQSNERWEANIPITSGTSVIDSSVSSALTLDPVYYHQFLVTFAYSTNDLTKIDNFNNLVTYTQFGSPMHVSTDSSGALTKSSDWADAGTPVTFVSPISVSTTERYQISSGDSGTFVAIPSVSSSSVSVDPEYYHQFLATASFVTSDGSTPSSAVVLNGVQFGNSNFQVALNTAPQNVWLDSQTTWSVNNPIVALSSTERWDAMSGNSGSVSGSTTIDPFYYHQFFLTVNTSPSGLAPSPATPSSGWYNAGSSVSLNASPTSGYVFVYWQVDGVNQTELLQSLSVTMDQAHTVTAVYQTPSGAINTLILTVNGMHLPKGIQTSLDAKLAAAQASLQRGNDQTAINELDAFVNETYAQSGVHITSAQAELLDSFAQEIINTI